MQLVCLPTIFFFAESICVGVPQAASVDKKEKTHDITEKRSPPSSSLSEGLALALGCYSLVPDCWKVPDQRK
jgi:hypothetical protein